MGRLFRFTALASLLSATSCSTGATSSTPTVQTVDIAKTAKLQFAVGTATISWGAATTVPGSGSTTSMTFIGTNFTATFRGANGLSATLVNTPTITGPPSFSFGFPNTPNSVSGILPNVFNSAVIAATSSKPLGLLPPSFGATLGPLVGVFGYGMAADNLLSVQTTLNIAKLPQYPDTSSAECPDLSSGGINTETSPNLSVSQVVVGPFGNASVPNTAQAQSHELGLPLIAGLAGVPSLCPADSLSASVPTDSTNYPVNYYGGPPAWPSAQGYGTPAFFIGYPLGFTDVATPPVAGKYSLDVAFATNGNSTTYGHADASATLTTSVPLPPVSITSAMVNSDGTTSVVLTVPPGLFETVVMLRTLNCGNPNGPNNNFSIVTHSAGLQRLLFAANLGPPDSSGRPTATTCNGYPGLAYAVGFDYPAYESSYPFDVSQTPKIANGDGHTGQADITTSAPVALTYSP
jgi:hypothetical protein